MENRNKLSEITRKLSEISLNISRVPSNTKKEFISLANAEFCGDYGLTLHWILSQAIEYQSMKALFFDKLQNIEDKIESLKEQNMSEEVRKTFNGRRIESKGGATNE